MGIVRDDRESLRAALEAAAEHDFVLSTGGVSVGDFDYVKEVMEEIGLRRVFWRVAQKPGKPLVFAVGRRALFFGLPGNPVSAMVCFHLYVAPALRKALGQTRVHPPRLRVVLGGDVRTAAGLTEFVRCTLAEEEKGWIARPTGSQSSGVLRSLSLADVLVVSPPGHDGFAAGDVATALRIGSEPGCASTGAFA